MSDEKDLIKKFLGSHKEQALVGHVLREIHGGRNLDDILQDAYVTNRASPLERRALLDHAEISEAVAAESIDQIRSKLI